MKKTILAAAGLLTATAAAAQVAPQMAPRDGVQTRTEAVERVRAMFTRADGNRDGYITQAEADAVRGSMMGKMRARGQARAADPARRAAAFDRLDTNRDNMVSRDEWTRAQAMRGERRAERGQRGQRGQRMALRGGGGGTMMLRMADANRDNRVSLQEATNAALQRFDQADANRDGRITQDERQQMRQAMRQRWQQQRGQSPTR